MSWRSTSAVVVRGVGWKIGAASQDIRRAEGVPGPSPGRIYEGTVFSTGASLGPEYFINYRNIECEFAFRLGLDFPVRDEEYTEADASAAIDTLSPVLELGDTVFLDWYGASSYFGSCLDNGGGAALIQGATVSNWRDVDLVSCRDGPVPEWLVHQIWAGAGSYGPSRDQPDVDDQLGREPWPSRARRGGNQHRDVHRALFRQSWRCRQCRFRPLGTGGSEFHMNLIVFRPSR